MTEVEAKKVLSVMKAAYPNAYKGMTREEGFGVVHLWQMQFADIPAELVMTAVNRSIGKSVFPPSVADVKAELREIREEASEKLYYHDWGTIVLPERQAAELRTVERALAPLDKAEGQELAYFLQGLALPESKGGTQ